MADDLTPPEELGKPVKTDRTQGKKEESETSDSRRLFGLLGLGVQLALTVGVFTAAGWWADANWGWSPWGKQGLGLVGIVVGLYFCERSHKVTGFLRATSIGVLILAGVFAVAVEALCWMKGEEWRAPLYSGGAAGFVINLLGYPFMLKLAVLPPESVKSGQAWAWWLPGVCVRMAGIAGMMAAMHGRFVVHASGVTLAAMAVYMAGMFAELAWIGRRFHSMDKR